MIRLVAHIDSPGFGYASVCPSYVLGFMLLFWQYEITRKMSQKDI